MGAMCYMTASQTFQLNRKQNQSLLLLFLFKRILFPPSLTSREEKIQTKQIQFGHFSLKRLSSKYRHILKLKLKQVQAIKGTLAILMVTWKDSRAGAETWQEITIRRSRRCVCEMLDGTVTFLKMS